MLNPLNLYESNESFIDNKIFNGFNGLNGLNFRYAQLCMVDIATVEVGNQVIYLYPQEVAIL